jgi:hypothetical protein
MPWPARDQSGATEISWADLVDLQRSCTLFDTFFVSKNYWQHPQYRRPRRSHDWQHRLQTISTPSASIQFLAAASCSAKM